MKRFRLRAGSIVVLSVWLFACDSGGPANTQSETSAGRPGASDMGSDASVDGGVWEETELGDSTEEWPDSLHTIPVVELPQAVSEVEVPAGYEAHAPFEISIGVGPSRFALSAESVSPG